MQPFSRILVTLDMTGYDEVVLRYTSFFCEAIRPDVIHLLHVSGQTWFPKAVGVEYIDETDEKRPRNEILSSKVRSLSNKYFSSLDSRIQIDIVEGKPLDIILDKAEELDIDLIISGRKNQEHSSGVLVNRLVRKSSNSILLIGDNEMLILDKILVPIDFSAYSSKAMSKGIEIAEKFELKKLLTLHVFDVPVFNYYKINMTYEKYLDEILSLMREHFAKFASNFGSKKDMLIMRFEENKHLNPARHIYDYSTKILPDLIVIGARGHSALDRFLVGSVTEKLLTFPIQSNILVVRETKRN